MSNNGSLTRWFWEDMFPHLLVAALAGLGAILIPNEALKAVLLGVAILAIVIIAVTKVAVPVLRRIFRNAMNSPVRAQIMHSGVHECRDRLVDILPRVPLVSQGGTSAIRCLPSLLAPDSPNVTTLLETTVAMFCTHVGHGINVWGSIRELRPDGLYWTTHRTGRFTQSRRESSTALNVNTATIRRLRESYDRGKCVIVTGSGCGEDLWTKQSNDEHGDDRCVLMGAIVVKSAWGNSTKKERLMVWVVNICSSDPHAFSDSHIPTMQACVDLFSILANVSAREHWLKHLKSSNKGVEHSR